MKKKNDPVALFHQTKTSWKKDKFLTSRTDLKEGRKLELQKRNQQYVWAWMISWYLYYGQFIANEGKLILWLWKYVKSSLLIENDIVKDTLCKLFVLLELYFARQKLLYFLWMFLQLIHAWKPQKVPLLCQFVYQLRLVVSCQSVVCHCNYPFPIP